jgi:hypothetical protein
LVSAVPPELVERFRPLLPVGYEAGVRAYQAAVAELTAFDLAEHYTRGITFFHERFVPHLKMTLEKLSGSVWCLDDYVAYAAGTDVDLMTHVLEAVAVREKVAIFPGDWFGFRVGCTQTANIHWDANGGSLGCVCVPSVRNGHTTPDMLDFLQRCETGLLNLNLFPTLTADERTQVSRDLFPVLDRSLLSISFSRGFGLTASQLGVILVHRDHPYRKRFQQQWTWFTNFFNAIAARAFMLLDLDAVQSQDDRRREWVLNWLRQQGLPAVESGSYYVKSFRVTGELPEYLRPLVRDDVVRLCFKPSPML